MQRAQLLNKPYLPPDITLEAYYLTASLMALVLLDKPPFADWVLLATMIPNWILFIGDCREHARLLARIEPLL
jgi:hypothetical protein